VYIYFVTLLLKVFLLLAVDGMLERERHYNSTKNEKKEGTHFQKTAQCDRRITWSVYVMERVGVLDALYTHSVYK
jgi:hypothetical protein